MFIKLTRSGPRRYVQLVESFRDDDGRVKQRTIASLGRLERIDPHVESVIRGLQRVTGRAIEPQPEPPVLHFEPARAIGDVWSLTSLWEELGFSDLAGIFKRSRRQIDVEALLRIMVFNRLCDPESKLGVLRWLETVSLPDLRVTHVDHQHLLRAMDALIQHQPEVDQAMAVLLRPLLDQELSVVFYDLTTIRAEGLSQQDEDVRQFGLSKDGGIRRQFVLGVVQTAEGLPIYHEVFDGNVSEVSTLKNTLSKVLERFPIRRVIAVADRGLLSTDNLEQLQSLTTPSGTPLEFILAVPGRRYNDFVELLDPFQSACREATTEQLFETQWQGLRLVVAHDPQRAAEQSTQRDAAISTLTAQADAWAEKLDAQDSGKSERGRRLSDGGATAKFYRAVSEAKLAKIIRVDLKSDVFSYDIHQPALDRARVMDGKLLLVTNTPDLSASEVIARYKSLADIERGFRVLKSEIEIGPVHHRLPERIRAHAYLCFMALILYRVMRQRLQQADSGLSPERALSQLRRVQHHRIEIGQTPHTGISTITPKQAAILATLGIEKPTESRQLSLL